MANGRQQRRERLLKAAQRAVVMHGADVRLKDIADMAGLTSGAILYHFPDVQSLLLEANRAVIKRFYDNRLRAIEGLSSPGEMLVVTIASGLPVDSDDEDDPAVWELYAQLGDDEFVTGYCVAVVDVHDTYRPESEES